MIEKEIIVKRCSNCGGSLKFIGLYALRYGGTVGGFNLLSGGVGEIGEGTWPLNFYQCETCGHIEMFDKYQYPEYKPPKKI